MKDQLPLVSVITVTYNASQYIEETIEGVLAQSYTNIEYIVVDGASTDDTPDIVRRYGKRVSHFISEPDGGIYDAMNKGIRMSHGDIIGIINASDWYEPDAVAKVVAAADEDGDAVIFHGDVNMLNADGTFFKHKRPSLDSDEFRRGMCMYHPTFFVRRSVYDKQGLFNLDYRLSADYDFALRCALAGVRFHYIDAVISNFRKGGVSATGQERGLDECRRILLNNGFTQKYADDMAAQWRRVNFRNRLTESVYDAMRRVVPAGMMAWLAQQVSVK